MRSQNKCLNAAFAVHHGTFIYFLTAVLIFRISLNNPCFQTRERGDSSRLDKCRQMRTGHLRRVCHTMHLSEMLSYFDGNIHCQFMRACRLHCWLRNVGIKRAVLTDSCTAVAFLTCHTRTRACWRLRGKHDAASGGGGVMGKLRLYLFDSSCR